MSRIKLKIRHSVSDNVALWIVKVEIL